MASAAKLLYVTLAIATLSALTALAVPPPAAPPSQAPFSAYTSYSSATPYERTKVLILGGGMAGVTAARTLHDQGIDDFILIEARHELGGRMLSHRLGEPDRQYTVELGANWVQGTKTGDGPENPVWTLANRHRLETRFSSYFTGLSEYFLRRFTSYH